MQNYYEEFIKPKDIIKDINYFYNKIRDLICNEFFGQYLYNKRKKKKSEEFIKNDFLSLNSDNTRLRFNNDVIIVRFKVSRDEKGKTIINKPIYKDYRIHDMIFDIDVVISHQEEKERMIYPENDALRELRRCITSINEFYVNKFRRDEENKYQIIYKRLKNLEISYYKDWNRLIDFITECVNPDFNENLNKFDEILKGINCNQMTMIYKLVHQTQFFQKYAHNRQIKLNKFFKSFRNECLDGDEIIELTSKLASCFGHHIKDYDESIIFIENLIKHFNLVCHDKEKKINKFVSDNAN